MRILRELKQYTFSHFKITGKEIKEAFKVIYREFKKKPLFNASGENVTQSLIFGNTSNILNVRNPKYPWAKNIWDAMLANSWIPEKSPMVNDHRDLTKMSEKEKDAVLKVLSFLIYLDSIQTSIVGVIASYITAPEVTLCLARQTFEEALHSSSYSYILNCVFSEEEGDLAIAYWQKDEHLLERNKEIASYYEAFIDRPSIDTFIMAVVANYLLENVYFYNGFNFFWLLASRGLLIDTCTQIKYINRDELTHGALFRQIILTIQKENPIEWKNNETAIINLFKTVAQFDIDFFLRITSGILGISQKSTTGYTHYLVNKRAVEIGLPQLFEDVENPYKHLDVLSGINDNTTSKHNLFEVGTTDYQQQTVLSGWDKLLSKHEGK